MAVKASVTITISKYRDTDSITRYYKLQASTAAAPAVPTTLTPSGWSTSEPTYTSGSTNTLYYTDCIVFSDGTFQYTDDGNGKAVKSSSYEAAKEAYNKAQNAQDSINNLEIGGRNYFLKSNTFTSAGSTANDNKIRPSIENGLWKIIVTDPDNSNYHSWSHDNLIANNFSLNDDFVFSFEIKSDDCISTRPPTIYFKAGMGYYYTIGTVSSEWSRCYYIGKWNTTNNINFHFGWGNLQGTYYIRKIKFEKGNKLTDWGLAPEDLVDEACDIVNSRGEQLVVNGTGMLGNNSNFSKFEFDGANAYNCPGSFKKKTKAYPVETDEFFSVNPDKSYKLTTYMKTTLGTMRFYDMLTFYDADKKLIDASQHMYISGSLTELAEDLKNGDTTVKLVDASGFNEYDQTYKNGFIFWNYVNSFGYQYLPETYSRYVYTDLYTKTDIDKTNNIITLKTAWNKGTIPAGTKVSQPSSGGTYKYIHGNELIPNEWTKFSGIVGGIDYSGQNANGKFPPGTAYAKVGWLWNYNNVDDFAWVCNVSVTENLSAKETVINVDVEYYLSTSSISLSGGSWSTTAPQWVDGKYMWSRQKIKYGDNRIEYKNQTCIAGAKGSTGPGTKYFGTRNWTQSQIDNTYVIGYSSVWSNQFNMATQVGDLLLVVVTNTTNNSKLNYICEVTTGCTTSGSPTAKIVSITKDGENGIGISSIIEQYYFSTSDQTPTGGEWKNTQEDYQNGLYIWTRSKITWTDNTITYSEPILATAIETLFDTIDNIFDQISQNGGKNIHLNDSAEDYFIMFKQKGNTHIKNGIPKPIKALPSTYQRLRYVEVPQEAYIDLGIPMSTNYSMETKIDVNGLTTNNQYFLGEAPGYISHLYVMNAANGRYIGVGNHRKGTWEIGSYKYEDGQPMIIETIMKPKLVCKVNNNIVYEDDQNMTDYTSSYNGILFAYRFNGSVNTSYAFQGRCYYFKLFDQNGNLIRDLIPCYEHNEYEGTDQEDEHPVRVGFYDRVTETFLINSGTGTFVKGANVGDLRTDITDGNKRFQTYNFTLEGVNLNADDYLADDGIHIVDKSITVQSGETSVIIDDIKDDGYYYCNVPATLEGHTLTFESALSSDVVVLYESSSETVIPYTDRQQDEYEHIINLYTYQDNTNIYSDGNLEIEYVRNNGLNIYQLKSDSEKRYKITNNKLATIESENGEIKLTAENAKNLSDDNDKAIKQLQKDLNEFKVTSEGVQNTLKSKGGNNLALYTLELWTSHASLTESDINEIKSNSLGGRGYILGNGTSELNIPVPNGTYTISFKYKKIGTSGTTATVKINDETPGTILTKTVWGDTYALTSSQPEDWETNYKDYYTVNNGVYYHVSGDIPPTWIANTYYRLDLTNYVKTVDITNNNIKIEIIGNSNNILYMCDLMVNPGEIAETWTQNPNETRTDTVTIGKGIKVENSNSNTYTKIDDDGTRVFNNENKDNPEEVARFTKEGINVKEIVVREKANISGLVIQEIGGQIWITNIL